jgi:hypothetical protein
MRWLRELDGFSTQDDRAGPFVTLPATLVISAVMVNVKRFRMDLDCSHGRGYPFI